MGSNEALWAEHGGLLGLVLFAGFILFTFFINLMNRKDKTNQKFIKDILDDSKTERREMIQDHHKSATRLADALDSLTKELKREHKED